MSEALDLGGAHVAAATPFDPVTGDVDPVAFRANARAWMGQGVQGLVVSGSTGEAVLLDDTERLVLIEAARGVVPADRVLIAGTGAESTRATIGRTIAAAQAGADAALVMPPAFYGEGMGPGALRSHFEAVADAAPIPVILYQVPLRFATLELATGLVSALAEHENIVGLKDSRGDLELVAALVEATPGGFEVLVGSGAHLYASLELGARGGILGVANLVGGDCASLVAAYRRGSHAEAGRLQERVGPIHKGIVAGLGVAGVKAALDILGFVGGPPRPPLRPLREEDRKRVEAILRRAGVPS